MPRPSDLDPSRDYDLESKDARPARPKSRIPIITGHVVRVGASHITACGAGMSAFPSAVALDYDPAKGYREHGTDKPFSYTNVCTICRKKCIPSEGATWGLTF